MADHSQIPKIRFLLLGASHLLIILSCRQQEGENAADHARREHYAEVIEVRTVPAVKGNFAMEALHTGGTRKLKPIVMTSLTTILALTPVLISTDMGSELQEPLALAIIGGHGNGNPGKPLLHPAGVPVFLQERI